MEENKGKRPDPEGENRQSAALAGLAAALLILVLGLFLVHILRHKAAVEDCLMAGRRDCSAVTSGN
jgi:uncharacterized membrane protein